MKVAVLSNGSELRFPAKTSDEVIKATVKRIMGVSDGPSINKVLEDLGVKLTEKEKIDFYGPAAKQTAQTIESASKKLIEALSTLNKDLVKSNQAVVEKVTGSVSELVEKVTGSVSELVESQSKAVNKLDMKPLEKEIKEVAKQIVHLANKMETIFVKNNKDMDSLLQLFIEGNKAVKDQSDNIGELVKILSKPKKIELLFDAQGKVKGIKNESV